MTPTDHRHRTNHAALNVRNTPPVAHVITVIQVGHLRGEGCCEADPVRQVITYYDVKTGEVLAERDPSPTFIDETVPPPAPSDPTGDDQ